MQNYYNEYLKMLEEQVRQQAESRKGSLNNTLNSINNYRNKLNNVKNTFNGFAQSPNPAIENAISDVLGNKTVQSNMSAIGNKIMSKLGSGIEGLSNISGGVKSLGSSITGNTAATIGSAPATTAMSGGSSFINPATALASLGKMAIDGTNRKRAKQSAENLVKNTNSLAEEINNNQGVNELIDIAPQEKLVSNISETGLNNLNLTSQNETDTNADIQSYSPVQQGSVVKNVGNPSIIDKLANGIGDLQKGFNENLSTPFSPQNMYSDKSKGGMTRLGEAVGTMTRSLQKPAVQGLVAGGLSTLLTGNPLYGLGMGYKFANKRSMSDIYSKALKDMGIDTDTGTFGNVDKTDFKTLTDPELKKYYYDTLANYRQAMLQDRMKRTEADKNYKEGRIRVEQQNANTRTVNSLKQRTPKPKKLTKKQQRLNALANYKKIKATGNSKNIDAAKKNYIIQFERNPDYDLL